MAKRPPRIAPRKPKAAGAASNAQRFVDGGRPGDQGTGVRGGKSTFARADGRELARVYAYVSPEQKKKLEVLCIEQDTTVSDVIADLIKKYLGEA